MSTKDVPSAAEPLEKIFTGLKNRSGEIRLQSAQELRKHVGTV